MQRKEMPCFVKFTERVNMPHSGLRGSWSRSVKANVFTERI